MLSTISYVLLVGGIMTAEGLFQKMHQHRISGAALGKCGDCGDPLYLTPYIKQGRLAEARNKSKVDSSDFHGVKSYSGFLTVDEARSSNTFFWYFPAEKKPENASVVLWLQGGPGASSLYGLFTENGPFSYNNDTDKVELRNHSWSKNNHLIFIDNPVNTGFSWTKSGMTKNETVVGNNLYSALLQFFKMFPDLQKNEFYVTGESYAGKYVPAVCYTIHCENKNASQKINLKGFAIGNGYSDPVHQLSYAPYLYQLGLVDDKGEKQMAALAKKIEDDMKAKKWMDAYKGLDDLLGFENPNPLFYNLTAIDNIYNYVEFALPSLDDYANLFKKPKIRKAIHVGNLTYNNGSDVFENLREDIPQSVAGWVGELLSYYRGVIYNGQLDIIVAYPLTESYLKALNFSSAAEYKNASRCKWRVDNGSTNKTTLAGYAKTAGNLTEVLVRSAGHMVPTDQPVAALDLLHRLTSNKTFC